MHHCCYSYWNRIAIGEYVLFHDNELNCTVGAKVINKKLYIDQIYGTYNKYVGIDDRNTICNVLGISLSHTTEIVENHLPF